MASSTDFAALRRQWASSPRLDNAILRLNFGCGGARAEEEEGDCCEKCGARGTAKVSVRRREGSAKFRKSRKGRDKKGRKALLVRCAVCRHVAKTLEMPERSKVKGRQSLQQGESKGQKNSEQSQGGSEKPKSSEPSSESSSAKKKKKKKRGKEEFAGLNLPQKSRVTPAKPLKAGDEKLLQMLRKSWAASDSDRLGAFLRK